jgi:hypothetical protein
MGTNSRKSKAVKPRPAPKVVHTTFADASARNPKGYTVAFQKTPDAPLFYLKTAEANPAGGGLIWMFVADVYEAGLWDLDDFRKLLERVREDIPHAVGVAVV